MRTSNIECVLSNIECGHRTSNADIEHRMRFIEYRMRTSNIECVLSNIECGHRTSNADIEYRIRFINQMNDRDYWQPYYLPISKLRSAVASLPLARYCRPSCLGPEWRARDRVICACAEFISYLDIPISVFDFRIRCSIFSYSTFDFRIRYSIKRIRCSMSAFDIR